MRWEELSTTKIDVLSRDTICVLPLGAVEQHGPHLPLATDILIAEALAARLDAASGGRLLILPGPRTGCSDHHMEFAGTLTLRHETFAAAVMETLGAAIRHGFRRFLLLNGHGGNAAIGGVIAEQAGARWPEADVVFTSWFRAAADRLRPLVEGEYPAVGHACEFETSVVLALRPDLVDMKLAKDDGIAPTAPMLRFDLLSGAAASRALPFHRITKRGVWGRPTLATVAKGRKILQITTGALTELVRNCWPAASMDDGQPLTAPGLVSTARRQPSTCPERGTRSVASRRTVNGGRP